MSAVSPAHSERPQRFVVVGNGVAGTTCAEMLRKLEPACSITLVGREPHPLYNRVSLPRVLQGRLQPERTVIHDRDWHAQRGIRLLLERTAQRLDTAEQAVALDDDSMLPWDGLLIATGGRPHRLAVPGGDAPNVLHFQTLDDTMALVEAAAAARRERGDHARAVVVGGSFISYELSEGLRAQGLKVTWLMRGPRFLRRMLNERAGALVDRIAAAHGVDVVHGEQPVRIVTQGGRATAVETQSGRRFEGDLVGVGVGLQLYTDWLADTPLTCGPQGVRVDQRLWTGLPGIYAAGDIASFHDPLVGRHHRMGTWDNALLHGRLAARNLLGAAEAYREVPTYSTPLFSSTISVLGMTPEDADGIEDVSRVDDQAQESRTLFFLGERLVGAVLIGSVKGRRRLLEWVKSGRPVAAAERRALLRGE